MFVFRNVLEEGGAKLFDRKCRDRDMDVGDQVAVGFDREEVIERRLIVEVERFDIFELIELFAGDDAFGGEVEGDDGWFVAEGQIAGHADQNECDGHDRAVGIERPGDDDDQENDRNDGGFWSQFERIMLERIPVKEYAPVAGRELWDFLVRAAVIRMK